MYGDFRDKATWILAGPHGINWASLRSLILCRDLWTCVGSTSPWNYNKSILETSTCVKCAISLMHASKHLFFRCRWKIYLNNVENRNETVSGISILCSRHHHVLRLQQSSHHIENCRFSYTCFVGIGRKRRVAGHQEMQSRRWNERRQQSHKIIIHVRWIPEKT